MAAVATTGRAAFGFESGGARLCTVMVLVTISSIFVILQETLAQIALSDTAHMLTLSEPLRASVLSNIIYTYQH